MSSTPRDAHTIYVLYHTDPDHRGRRRFTATRWYENDPLGLGWRGQVFFADPGPHKARWREQGFTVREQNELPQNG